MSSNPPTRKETILEILRELKRRAIAEEIILILDSKLTAQGVSLADRVRIGQGTHGTLSILHDEGKIRRYLSTNPVTGREVYEYEIEQIQRAPAPKVSKTWKEKAEQLQVELKRETERADWLAKRNEIYKNDSVSKDQLADAFYAAKESGDWESLKNLFVKKVA